MIEAQAIVGFLLSAVSGLFGVVFVFYRVLTDKITQQAQTIDQLNTSVMELSNKVNVEQSKHQQTKNQLSETETRLSVLRDQYEQSIQQKALLQSQVDLLYARIGNLEDDFKARFEQQAQTINTQNGKLETVQGELVGVRDRLHAEEKRAEEFERLYRDALKDASDWKDRYNTQNLEWSKKYQAKHNEVEQLTQENMLLMKKIEALIESAQKDRDDMQKRVESLQLAVETLTQRVLQLSASVTSLIEEKASNHVESE